jgi:hypothetical protein
MISVCGPSGDGAGCCDEGEDGELTILLHK